MMSALGQAVGTLNGTVLDAAGAVVPGAKVLVINSETKVENTTTSTSAGAYTVPYLPQGTYSIRVAMAGFRTATADNVVLRAAQTLTVNISLEVGQVSEQVTVSDTPPLLEAGTAEIGRYINKEEFDSWPIVTSDGQRQIQQFIFDSLPGTTGGTWQGSINGGQQFSHEIMIDGISLGRADIAGGNNNEMSPSLDAIGDFKLQTGAVGAEFNGGQTAVANYSIKSGTNTLHGSGFENLQNEAFNAASLSTTSTGAKKAKYRDNNWGYSLGGPVFIPKIYDGRNKTFWFTNFEHDNRNQMNPSGFGTLANTNYKSGDFSQLYDSSFTGKSLSGSTVGTDALGRSVAFGAIYDPSSTRSTAGGLVRDPFSGNKIPTSRFDPVAAAVLKVGVTDPTYSSMVRNVQTVGGQPFFKEHIFGIKGDHIITDKHRISVFVNQGMRDRNNNGSTTYLPVPGLPTSTWREQRTPSNMVRLSLTSTLSPTLINNFAAGFNRFVNNNGAVPEVINKNWAEKLGIQGTSATTFPDFNFSGNDYQGGTIARMGVGSYGGSANGSWVFKDDATKIWNKHTFHIGYQYTRYFYNEQNYSDSGNYYFTPTETALPGYTSDTGNAYASFLLGAVNHASHSISGLSSGFRGPYHAMWFSDDIKVTPKLTMNIGLRYEIITPFFERTNRMSYIDLSASDPDAGGRPGLLTFKNRPANVTSQMGPRLGFAYQLTNKIVVRTGYAMMNTPPITAGWGYSGFTTGYNATVNVAAGSSSTGFAQDPAMYLSDAFPSLGYTLPNTNTANGHFNASQTASPDANRPGYVQNYNLSVQYLMPNETVLEVAYVGNHGTRIYGFNAVNVTPATKLALGDTLIDPVSSHPSYSPYSGFPTTQTVAQAIRPYPQYYGISDAYAYNTSSDYNSLQVTVTKHLTKGFGYLASYTWSKTMGYQDSMGATAYGVPQDYYNRRLERSVASFDHAHNLKLTWTYNIPVGKNQKFDLKWANSIVGGWEFSGIHNYMSGAPISISSGGLNTPSGFGSIRPDVVSSTLSNGGVPSSTDYSQTVQWLNASSFSNVPTTGNSVPLRVGTAPRYFSQLRGPLGLSENFQMSKVYPFFKEKARFKVGATMTNPFKRATPYLVDTTVGDSAFGQMLKSGGDRTMQLIGRIDF